MAGPGILCVSSSPEAQEILRVRLFTVSFVCGNIYDNSAVLTSLFLFVFIYSVLHRKRLSLIRPLPYRTMSRLILYTLMALQVSNCSNVFMLNEMSSDINTLTKKSTHKLYDYIYSNKYYPLSFVIKQNSSSSRISSKCSRI